METETNFKIYNPLQQLEQGSLGGGSGPPPPGSVTGGAGGSIANGTITNINIAPGTITGGPGGNIGTGTVTGGTGGNIAPGTVTGGPGGDLAAGTVTGGPGGNIAANTITAGELAAGASAANINSGPAGAVTGSKISKADNTNFGVIEFDPSGDLTQTAAGSGIALLKTGAAAANINAGPAGAINSSQISGGPFLSSAPGSVTGGPGGNIAAGTVTGGSGGDLAAGTVTGGPGGNIAANTITAGELAPGAAAANINSGPAGAINSSQIAGGPFLSAGTNAGNTQFGVVEFDPSGDLTQTAPNSGIALLKTGAAAANINAGPAGSINSSQISGGPFLSTAGGTMTGAITQPLAPVAGTDLANKTYVDSLSGPKAFAKFIKQVPQNMTAGTATVITWPIQETPTANATSAAGNITMSGAGVATLTSTSTAQTAWRVVFSGQSINDPTTAAGRINFAVFNNTTSATVGNNSSAFCFSGPLPQAFTDAYLQEYFILAPSATVSFSIQGGNPGSNIIVLGTSGSNSNPLLCIEQIY